VEFITQLSNKPSKAPEDINYVTAIRELQKSLGRQVKPQWVKGHQDDQTEYEMLPLEAQLNIDLDIFATNHLMGTVNKPTREYSTHTLAQDLCGS
jgi:ribonuclease HI